MPYKIYNLACPRDDRMKTHQLIIRAVSGLVCLTELMPPRKLTSRFTPSTCVLLTSKFPLPNYRLRGISPNFEKELGQ